MFWGLTIWDWVASWCSPLWGILFLPVSAFLVAFKENVSNRNQRHVLHLDAELRVSHQLMSQTKVLRVITVESKVLTKLLKVRIFINKTQLCQKNSTT